ncbi:MAG: class I SAM-dependent methyltransferase [Acidobacteriota bacterium]
MSEQTDLLAIAKRMQRDWQQRAQQDAEHYVYTRDPSSDGLDFDASGLANYRQLVQPYLPVLLRGRAPDRARVLEIGCGVGRMTRWFAEHFAEVHGIDVAPEMIAKARERLAAYPNVHLQVGSATISSQCTMRISTSFSPTSFSSTSRPRRSSPTTFARPRAS